MTPSLRVYFVAHSESRVSGILMRAHERPIDRPTPAAIGTSESDVLVQLEAILAERLASGEDALERYLFSESFTTRELAVHVHPRAAVKKRTVIGKKEIPLRLTYVYSELGRGGGSSGGFRVMLPRFGWWFVVEELSLAAEVVRGAITTALLGESARSIYDFRRDGEEYVREWSPRVFVESRAAGDARRSDADALPTTRAVCEELVEKVARGKLGAWIVGDSEELEASRALFDLDPLPSVLLVGGAGVGKTTFVRRLARIFAQRRKSGGAPRIWSTTADRILSGMTYVGMWQKRSLDLVRELSHEGDYLHVDRLSSILEPQADGASIGEVFLEAVRAGEISVLAECTEQELDLCRRRAPSFVASFRVVRIEEPSQSRVPGLLALYQEKRGIAMHPAALARVTSHLATFQRDVLFPGKAFRFVDWLAQTSVSGSSERVLFPSDASSAYARYSGLPIELVSDDRPASPADLSRALRVGVIGQDDACDVAAKVLARLKAGLDDPERPCGSLLFVGPTGVGKTELAKQIARFLFGATDRMVRVDMSEYMRAGSAHRLLASGDDVTSLASAVRRQPMSLVLLDEIEKAHPEVLDLLLGVLGEGRLADEHGRLVDFRMTVIVMTSNLGTGGPEPVGFGAHGARDSTGFASAVRSHFRPELFNRIDHVVSFRALAPADLLRIVDLRLAELAARTGLVRRRLRLDVSDDARRRFAEIGWHPTRGARPLERAIEEHVVAPLAALLARDPALEDATIVVRVDGRASDFVVRALRPS